jgi:hypothetical protein
VPGDERRKFLLAVAAVEKLHIAVLVPADAVADEARPALSACMPQRDPLADITSAERSWRAATKPRFEQEGASSSVSTFGAASRAKKLARVRSDRDQSIYITLSPWWGNDGASDRELPAANCRFRSEPASSSLGWQFVRKIRSKDHFDF